MPKKWTAAFLYEPSEVSLFGTLARISVSVRGRQTSVKRRAGPKIEQHRRIIVHAAVDNGGRHSARDRISVAVDDNGRSRALRHRREERQRRAITRFEHHLNALADFQRLEIAVDEVGQQ